MYAILLSAFNTVLGFVFRSVLVKFVTFFALYFIVTEFIGVMQNAHLFPTAQSLTNAFGGISPALWYFFDLFCIPAGVPLILSALVTRFIIRRIPIIG